MARYPDVQYIRFHTDGNAARKVEVATPIKTMRLPRVKHRKCVTLRIDPLALTAIVTTVVMAILILIGFSRLEAAEQQTVEMQNRAATLQDENIALNDYFWENCDLDNVERTAMALGLVPRDQVTHITIQVPREHVQEEPGNWERFTTFLAGLFA